MDKPRYLSVTALTRYIKLKLENDEHLRYIYLEGEISNFKPHQRGHFYFTLKDQGASISAIMFSSAASLVNFRPADGMTVLVEGTISLYEPSGNYQINVYKLEQKGVGSLYLAFEQLKHELENGGYFDPSAKKPIPSYPKAIGVITSPTGAAIRDIINTIKRRYPLAKVFVYPTLVQGENAKESIANNIKLANMQKKVDILIVGRGGGSIEDLWAFNEKIVADAIYLSTIPIISAVGHETDFTIADFVADKRAATPTAAAELATPDIFALKDQLRNQYKRMVRAIKAKLDSAQFKLAYLEGQLQSNSPLVRLKHYQSKLETANYQLKLNINNQFTKANMKLNYAIKQLKALNPANRLIAYANKVSYNEQTLQRLYATILAHKTHRLHNLSQKLELLNPYNLMQKGYSIITKDNQIIKSKDSLSPHDMVTIMLSDGQVVAQIQEEENE